MARREDRGSKRREWERRKEERLLWPFAVHEAGCAVVALKAGVPINDPGLVLRMKTTRQLFVFDCAVHTQQADPSKLQRASAAFLRSAFTTLAVSMAGRVALREFHLPPIPGVGDDKTDWANLANRLATAEHWRENVFLIPNCPKSPQGILEVAMQVARASVADHRDAIEKLARVAIRKRRVSPEEIERITGLTPQPSSRMAD